MADRDRLARRAGEAHELTVWLESAAGAFDTFEPVQCMPHGGLDMVRWSVGDHLDTDPGVHGHAVNAVTLPGRLHRTGTRYCRAGARAACTAERKALALAVAPLTLSTCELWRVTTWPGRAAIRDAGYLVVTRVSATFEILPLWIVTATWTSPKRLVPEPL